MEMSTEENEHLVSVNYERSMNALHSNKKISESEMLVHEIESLSQEVNSGASFEQYFRWKGKREVDSILSYIEKINLPEVSLIVI
ncbi:MAG: hypothetical protein V3U92_15250 [Cellulophaga sp.]